MKYNKGFKMLPICSVYMVLCELQQLICMSLFHYVCLLGFGGYGSFGGKQQSTPMLGSFGGFGTGTGGPTFGQGKTI
jgi:hypothetical protein